MNELTLPADSTPASLVRLAIEKGAGLDQIQQLLALQERWEAGEARKAFVAAMVAFKAEPIDILKRKQVSFESKGGRTEYKHAELADVVAAIVPALQKHGLSHRWDIHQGDGGISVDCVLTHSLGHSEKVTMSAPPDGSGGKNPIQAVASTTSYLQRYTLLAITGTSTRGEDDDGAGADEGASLSAEDQAALEALRAAAQRGEKALQTEFQTSPISDAGWGIVRGALIETAKEVDRLAGRG